MTKTILLAGVAILSLTGLASAADPVGAAPGPVITEGGRAYSWSGAYFGVDVGHGWLDGDFSLGGVTASDDFDGATLGGFVGYNWQFSNGFVAGIEGDLSYNFNENEYLGAVDIGTDWAGSVRGKVGYALDRALVYAAGGWTATNGYINIDALNIDENETFHGWTIGAGVDYAVTDNLFLRGEYRYNDFTNKDINLGGIDIDTDLSQHVVKVGLGVKF
jgi:outer membrane immunogenic protein